MQKEQPKEQAVETKTASRRGFFVGAAAVGAAAAAVTTMPSINASSELNKLPPAPENGGGYSLSEHVKRYYQTTRV
jgi:hypothetical protein